jgi:hypothetical protein
MAAMTMANRSVIKRLDRSTWLRRTDRLLPTLRALEQRLGDRPDLRQAILASTEDR